MIRILSVAPTIFNWKIDKSIESVLRIIRKDKGSFSSIEISNHFTPRLLHLHYIPTSHGVNYATDGDESVELNLTRHTNSGLCLLS
jgi:hypothetical protein